MTRKTSKNDGFLTLFQSFLVLDPILAHPNYQIRTQWMILLTLAVIMFLVKTWLPKVFYEFSIRKDFTPLCGSKDKVKQEQQ